MTLVRHPPGPWTSTTPLFQGVAEITGLGPERGCVEAVRQMRVSLWMKKLIHGHIGGIVRRRRTTHHTKAGSLAMALHFHS